MVPVSRPPRRRQALGLDRPTEGSTVDAGLRDDVDEYSALLVPDGGRVGVEVDALRCGEGLGARRLRLGCQTTEATAEGAVAEYLVVGDGGGAAVVGVLGRQAALPATTSAPAIPAAQRRLVMPRFPSPQRCDARRHRTGKVMPDNRDRTSVDFRQNVTKGENGN